MSDTDLKETVYAVLGGILMFGLVFAVMSSKPWQKQQFLLDCAERWDTARCEEIWDDANQ